MVEESLNYYNECKCRTNTGENFMLPCAASASSLITGDVSVILTVIDGSLVVFTAITQPSTATSYFSSLTFCCNKTIIVRFILQLIHTRIILSAPNTNNYM